MMTNRTKNRWTPWLWVIAGLGLFSAGLRDIFAPGFLNGRPSSNLSMVLSLVSGAIFIAIAILFWIRIRRS